MPKLIYWNVEHFSWDKFWGRKRKRSADDEEEYGDNPAPNYLRVLFRTITQHNPDFIVIVEARPAGIAPQGTLLTDDGTMSLLRYLRVNHRPNWALVPPVISGTGIAGEGIAVFFQRSPTLFFTGPWRWPGGGGPAVPPPAAVGLLPAQYRFAFSRPISNRRTPNDAFILDNPNRTERGLGGQWRYRAGGAWINFPIFGTRRPFRTTFYDLAAQHNYTLVSAHMAPSQDGGVAGVAGAPSTLATAQVGALAEVTAVRAAETVVVVGDFNVSLFDGVATGAAYAGFGGAGYQQVFRQNAGHMVPAGYPSRGYLVTHIRPWRRGSPDSTDGYPAYGYGTITDVNGDYDSIDNAFIRGRAPARATIVNTVSGSPYTAVGAPADVPPGTLAYPSRMATPATLNVPAGYAPGAGNFHFRTGLFQDISNYGRVRGVSDHLPLVFDI